MYMNFFQSFFGYPRVALIFLLFIGAWMFWYIYPRRRDGRWGATRGIPAYTRDLTADAKAGNIEPVVGRENEIDRTIHILSRKTKNNPMLLGSPGVGKTAIVEGLANRIASGDVPDNLLGKRLLSLDLSGMISGTKYRGEFEERVKKLLSEILAAKRTMILFIDEAHMIVQTKGSEGALNVSDILKPSLARGDLQAIGATTTQEYEALIRPDDALDRRFQPVQVDEPKVPDALAIVRGIKDAYEKHHGVRYSDEALKAAVLLSKMHIKERFLPDKAIDLIDEAGATVGIEAHHHARAVAGLLHESGKTKRLAHEAQKKQLPAVHVKEPTVTAADIRRVVSEWTKIPMNKLV